jgi:hypothetical protein
MNEVNDIIIHKVDHLDTNHLAQLVDESVREGFRHIKRLVNDYVTGIKADLFYRSIGFSVDIDSEIESHFLRLELS